MYRRTPVVIAAMLLASGVVIVGLIGWARFAATRTMERTFQAVSHGLPVPSDVDLRLSGMEVALDTEPKLRTVLSSGYSISGPAYDWSYFPRRSFGYFIKLRVDIDMICEVHSSNEWLIGCSQIKCMVSPCRIHLGPNGVAWLDSSSPNTSLERTRAR